MEYLNKLGQSQLEDLKDDLDLIDELNGKIIETTPSKRSKRSSTPAKSKQNLSEAILKSLRPDMELKFKNEDQNEDEDEDQK